MTATDVLVVHPGTTAGWGTITGEFVGSLERLGITHRLAPIRLGPTRHLRRAWPLIDAVEALAARRALREGLAAGPVRAVVTMSTTGSFMAPVDRLHRNGVRLGIRLDCPAAVNRPGATNAGQRAIERRRFAAADIVIAMGPRSAAAVAPFAERVSALPTSIEVPPPRAPDTPARVIAYAANPHKKGLDTICAAWTVLGDRRRDAVLTVTGIEPARGRRFLTERGIAEPGAIEWTGLLPRERYLELLGAATALVSAPRMEEYGIVQLEALASGVPLVTAPAPGAYEAEPIARRLAPALVAAQSEPYDLAAALAAALAMPATARNEYAAAARPLLEPFGRPAADLIMRDQVLPALLGDAQP